MFENVGSSDRKVVIDESYLYLNKLQKNFVLLKGKTKYNGLALTPGLEIVV